MLPLELKIRALSAAQNAEISGFPATAEAFRYLAMICAEEELLLAAAMEQSRPAIGKSLGMKVPASSMLTD